MILSGELDNFVSGSFSSDFEIVGETTAIFLECLSPENFLESFDLKLDFEGLGEVGLSAFGLSGGFVSSIFAKFG